MACLSVDLLKNTSRMLSKETLVSIHGFGLGHRVLLRPVEFALEKSGKIEAVLSFQYQPHLNNLEESGKGILCVLVVTFLYSNGQLELSELLASLKQHTQTNTSVSFLTHSYGALVLREAFRHVSWEEQNSRIIMIAPPNRGCQYWSELRKYSAFINYGGKAGSEFSDGRLTEDKLDDRLGKLPLLCKPLVVAGKCAWNPLLGQQEPNDGVVTVHETTLPGHFRHHVRLIG